jgi:hypothetical protein
MILYGQSAGSGIVLMYSYANPQKPIVRGFIGTSSGTPLTNPTNSSNFHTVAQKTGCANLTATAELACMQNVDAQVLQRTVDEVNSDPQRGLFRPIADNVTCFTNLTERLDKGLVAKLVSLPSSTSGAATVGPRRGVKLTWKRRGAWTAFDRGIRVQRAGSLLTLRSRRHNSTATCDCSRCRGTDVQHQARDRVSSPWRIVGLIQS